MSRNWHALRPKSSRPIFLTWRADILRQRKGKQKAEAELAAKMKKEERLRVAQMEKEAAERKAREDEAARNKALEDLAAKMQVEEATQAARGGSQSQGFGGPVVIGKKFTANFFDLVDRQSLKSAAEEGDARAQYDLGQTA